MRQELAKKNSWWGLLDKVYSLWYLDNGRNNYALKPGKPGFSRQGEQYDRESKTRKTTSKR